MDAWIVSNKPSILRRPPKLSHIFLWGLFVAIHFTVVGSFHSVISPLKSTKTSNVSQRRVARPMLSMSTEPLVPVTGVELDREFWDKLGERKKMRGPDFEPNLGKVIETLRHDYPRIFLSAPDLTIYTRDIEVRDPSGVRLRGKIIYKQFFAMLRLINVVAFDETAMNYRIYYDWAKQEINVHWNVKIWVRTQQMPRYVDGISTYSVNDEGFVYRHKVDNVLINGIPSEPPYVLQWMDARSWLDLVGVGDSVPQPDLVPVPGMMTQPAIFQASENQGSNKDKNQKKGGGFSLPKVKLPAALGCEDSLDCDSPMICCDFVLFKVCCRDGGIAEPIRSPALIPIPIPVDRDPYPRYPQYPPY